METPNIFELVVPAKGDDLDDLPKPANGPYYVASHKGYMVMQDFHFGRTLTPISEATGAVGDIAPMLWHDIPKLPVELLGQAWSFFKTIFEQRHSESMVDITWSPEKGYRLFVPPQQATHGGVNAQRTPEHYTSQNVGTIHSHCDFSAFHSGTDTHDAKGHSGLHITIGKVNATKPEVAIMISNHDINWDMQLEDITDGELELVRHPAWWNGYVRDPIKKAVVTPPKIWGGVGTGTTLGATPSKATTLWKPEAPMPLFTEIKGTKPTTLDEIIVELQNKKLITDDEVADLDDLADRLEANLAELEEFFIFADIDYYTFPPQDLELEALSND